jgi:hypothetical protein
MASLALERSFKACKCDRSNVAACLRRLGSLDHEILAFTDRADQQMAEILQYTIRTLNEKDCQHSNE